MWFSDYEEKSCSNCKYGNKDITYKKCANCLLTYSLSGQKYVDWTEETKGGKLNDLLIQWYAWLWKIL